MAANPFANLTSGKGKPAAKSGGRKPVSAAQAKAVASFVKAKKMAPKPMKMDAEDKIDGGVDEATEKD